MDKDLIDQILSTLQGGDVDHVSFISKLKKALLSLEMKYIESANVQSGFYLSNKANSEKLADDLASVFFELATAQLYKQYDKLVTNKPVHVCNEKFTVGNLSIIFPEEVIVLQEIPSGEFLMGSNATNDRPLINVKIDSFYISEKPITGNQWNEVVGLQKVMRVLEPSKSGDKYHAASYYDVQEFCARLSQYTNLPISMPSESQWQYVSEKLTNLPDNVPNPNKFGLKDIYKFTWELTADNYYPNHLRNKKDGSPVLSS